MTEKVGDQVDGRISPISPNPMTHFSMDCDRSLVKSMENILISDISKQKSVKKQSYMRRSVTLKDVSEFKINRKSGTNMSFERMKIAKEKVEEAIKNGKVFSILGPYNRVRQVLRNRGWVEKFYFNNEIPSNNTNYKSRISNKLTEKSQIGNDDDNYDDGDDYIDDDDDTVGDELNLNGLQPWEEENGIYGIMSRMLKNVIPNLFWTLRKNQVDYKSLRKEQIINHHANAGCFTTKTGLAKNLNQLRWFDDKDPDEFFPRCYIISTVEEKHAFIDDFRFTACVGLLKEVIEKSTAQSTEIQSSENVVDSNAEKSLTDITNEKPSKKILPKIRYFERKSDNQNCISQVFLEMAIAYCEFILKIKKHEDIDRNEFIFCWSCDWDEFLVNYYKVVHEGFKIEGSQYANILKRCEDIAIELRKIFFQFDMEGSRNVWILKPGAKSRGRGIMCYTKLHEVLKLLSDSLITNETRFIIQKYIEKPLLVCNTKFDIRQWFLVTDWNPLTIWWYKDCYLRFCSQQFTLDDLNEAVHLSNNSIQYKYHNGPRSTVLPKENMWDWKQFDEWLKSIGRGDGWSSIILPGMKEAVIDALLCVQDCVDWRKNSFELYGADFMVSEGDLKPWLIEINSSPCMAPSTSITARLTSNVLEDIFKVVLDRRENKQCDTGQFELLYKPVQINIPPYIGIDLKLAGISIKNPISSTTLLSARRASTRPITDSVVLRNFKTSDDKAIHLRRKSQDTSILTSNVVSHTDLINKPTNVKSTFLHKRSNSSIITDTDQGKRLFSRKTLLAYQRNSATSMLKKTAKLFINTIKENSELINVTHSPSFENDRGDVDEDRNSITESILSSQVVKNLSDNPVLLNVDSDYNQSNDITVSQSLPTIPKQGIITKSNMNRQYKLPTKVEVVNFSMAKKMMNTSFKESHTRKKIKNNHVNKSINPQLLVQKYAFAKSIPSFHNFCKSFHKNLKLGRSYSLFNDPFRLPDKSKSTVSAYINSKTLKILTKRGDNNNNLILLDVTTQFM